MIRYCIVVLCMNKNVKTDLTHKRCMFDIADGCDNVKDKGAEYKTDSYEQIRKIIEDMSNQVVQSNTRKKILPFTRKRS